MAHNLHSHLVFLYCSHWLLFQWVLFWHYTQFEAICLELIFKIKYSLRKEYNKKT